MTGASVVRRGYADVAHGQMHFREAGQAGAPALLLLHQSPSSSVMYEVLMGALADRFYLLAPDNPGFGNSDALPGGAQSVSIEAYAGAVKAFLDVREVTGCFVFGHHTGAAIAVQLEHDFPGTASAMALSGPTLLTEEQRESLPQMASPFPAENSGAQWQSMWRRFRDKDPEASLSLTQREVLSAFACGDSYQASYRAVCRQDFAGQLETIKCPVLVFAGDEDPLYGAVEPTLALLAGGERAYLEGGERTYVCERQADQVAQLLAEFYESKESVTREPGA